MKTRSIFPILLLGLAVGTDLLTPYLVPKGWIPAQLRWISQGILALVIFWTILRMLVFDKFPPIVFFIAVFTALGFINAVFNGQSLVVTFWGWWLMFQFPFVAIFTYLQPYWPQKFSTYFLTGVITILGFEAVLQVYQYLRGTPPGDHLAGTFGWNGTGNLVLFIILVLSISLGEWLANRKTLPVLLTLFFGIVSSTLGEMKLFLPVTLVLGLLALSIFIFQRRDLLKLIPYATIFILIVSTFLFSYNAIVPAAQQIPLEEMLTNDELLSTYMGASTQRVYGSGVYTDIGRNFALRYGWDQISQNPMTLLFGIGLGGRSESTALGIAGQGLVQGGLGNSTGTSLLVIMQETGLLGLLSIVGFILITILSLFRKIKRQPFSTINGLRYGLILFSALWPLWLWYNTAWVLRVPMMLYWIALGYALGWSDRKPGIEGQVWHASSNLEDPIKDWQFTGRPKLLEQ